MKKNIIASFYLFTEISKTELISHNLQNISEKLKLKGTIILSKEGINSNISGEKEKVLEFINEIKKIDNFSELEYKITEVDHLPFGKIKVKIKEEIVTFKQCNCDPKNGVGKYIEPRDWNNILNDKEFIVIDVRNNYEVAEGTFKNAVNPNTDTFTEFAKFSEEKLKDKNQKIAMFCTGGIRCEKSTAYLVQRGYKNIFHLKGGILNYMKEIKSSESMWEGNCFVFDKRITVSKEVIQKEI